MIREKPVVIRLSPANARLLAENADGWLDAGACDGGLTPTEREALLSTYQQIMRQLIRRNPERRALQPQMKAKP